MPRDALDAVADDRLARRAGHADVPRAAHLLEAVAADRRTRRARHRRGAVLADRDDRVASDLRVVVLVDALAEVALRVQRDHLLPLQVLERQLVVAAAAGGRARDDPAPRLLLREVEGRQELLVEQRSEDHRPIGVAREEGDHHLHADARDELEAEAGAGPRLHRPHPARGALVALALAVPVKLHFDAPQLVGVDLVELGADDQRRLHDLLGARRRRRRARRRGGGREHELVSVRRLVSPLRVFSAVLERDDDVGRVEGPDLGAVDAQGAADLRARAATVGGRPPQPSAVLLEPQAGGALRERAGLELAVVVVLLEAPSHGLGLGLRRLGAQVERGALQVEVAQRHPRGARAPRDLERLQVGLAEQQAVTPLRDDERVRALDRIERARAIAEHEHLPRLRARLVLERVEDALLGEQALDEVEVALLVLHAVAARAVAARQPQAAGHSERAEQLADDRGDRLVLKDAAVLLVLQQRKRGHEPQLVGPAIGGARGHPDSDGAREPAVTMARAAALCEAQVGDRAHVVSGEHVGL